MFSYLIPKSTMSVGIDITNTAVKILALSRRNGQVFIENCGFAELPAGTIEENIIRNSEAVTEAVKHTVERMKVPCKEGVIALPTSAIIYKNIYVASSLTEEELEQQVFVEAEKHITFPMEEISYDFEVKELDKENNLRKVLLVVSRVKYVEQRASAVIMAGINVSAVDVECFAIERFCEYIAHKLTNRGKDRTIAVFDLGAQTLKLTILQNLEVVYTKEEIFGGTQLTQEIHKHFNAQKNFENFTNSHEKISVQFEEDILTPFKELISLQIKRALQSYLSAFHQAKVDQIVLIGGASTILTGLTEFISERLGIITTKFDPFENVEINKGADSDLISKKANSLVTCYGLALRKFST